LGWLGWYKSNPGFYPPERKCFVTDLQKEQGCTVCAIGGVLRSIGVTEHLIGQRAGSITEGDAEPSYVHMGKVYTDNLPKNWITAISYVWESLKKENNFYTENDSDVEEARDIMIEWVEENIPEDIDLVREVA